MDLSIERLRSPRRSSSSISFDQGSSACSTPYASAPSSPRYFSYYSAPASPRFDLDSAGEGAEAAVPFSWEERPGTPKSPPCSSSRSGMEMNGSVDRLAAMGFGFHFSAPVSPLRGEFEQHQGQSPNGLIDDFEFSSARMSDADSVVSHADELFFQGQILPLKLPGRLNHNKSSSLSITLQLQDYSSRKGDVFSPPRAASSLSSRREAPPSPRPQLKSPPRLSSPPPRSRSPSKLAKVGLPDRSNNRSSLHAPRRSLKELLHLSISAKVTDSRSGSVRSSSTGTDSRNNSIRSSASDSRSSSNSSSSQRFANSRSSSVSSNGGGRGSMSSSCSSRQINPVSSRELLQNYSKNYNKKEFRRKTFLPYRQGLLGCLGCLTMPSLRRVRDLEC